MPETEGEDSSQPQIRYRSSSVADLQSSDLEYAAKMRKTTRSQESTFSDKVRQNRGVVLAVSIPILVVSFVIYVSSPHRAVQEDVSGLIARGNGVEERNYAVIFDAGSSGSRVHVYSFDRDLNLLPMGKDLELFVQKKPGLSAYASNPKEAAESLNSLLEEAENVIPSDLQNKTPVRVGATAGLRTLGVETSDKILEEVRDFLEEKSSLRSKPEWVTVLDGTQEGAYQWVTINYLLGNLGKVYQNTVGVVDLGGGSVQMAYAISEDDASTAPKISDGEDNYVKELFLKRTKYFLYVHSYLKYGLLAARAEILKTDDNPAGSCILAGYNGTYKYGDTELDASSSKDGPSYTKCRTAAVEALSINEPACTHMKCTFGGIWNGGGGDGQKNLFVASYFYDRAAEAGFVEPTEPDAIVRPDEFKDAARKACETNMENASKNYPRVEAENLPYLCMDLVYQYTLLVDGFGLVPSQSITLVKKVKYRENLAEAAWPLGSAIEVASSSSSF